MRASDRSWVRLTKAARYVLARAPLTSWTMRVGVEYDKEGQGHREALRMMRDEAQGYGQALCMIDDES